MDKVATWTLPKELTTPDLGPAADLLSTYFHERAKDGSPSYSGSQFETFAGGGDRSTVANVFTPEDLLAVSLLRVHVPGEAVLQILGDKAQDLNRLLSDVRPDRELHKADYGDIGPKSSAEQLWDALRKAGVGPVTTSKLLARKRPKLLPVIDTVVKETLGHQPRTNFWLTLQHYLKTDGGRLHDNLLDIRQQAGVGEGVSAIRCFDVIVWRVGRREGLGRRRGRFGT